MRPVPNPGRTDIDPPVPYGQNQHGRLARQKRRRTVRRSKLPSRTPEVAHPIPRIAAGTAGLTCTY